MHRCAVMLSLLLSAQTARGETSSAAADNPTPRDPVQLDFGVDYDTRGGHTLSVWFEPVHGETREKLGGAKLYEYLGRQDLASRYALRNALDWAFAIYGPCATIGAFVLGAKCDGCDLSAGALLVTGIATWITSFFFTPNPIGLRELVRTTEEFNAGLLRPTQRTVPEPEPEPARKPSPPSGNPVYDL